jgi:hypothetical protein
MFARFQGDKAPYLVAVVFGVLGWTLVHIDDELTQAPTLEFEEVVDAPPGVKPLPCEPAQAPESDLIASGFRIENLSRATSFSNLEFVLHGGDGDPRFKGVRLVPEPPAVLPEDTDPEVCGRYAKFEIPQVQPGWRFRLYVWMPKSRSHPYLTYSADDAVRLERQSWETTVARHERSILEWLAGAAALVLMLWATFARSTT